VTPGQRARARLLALTLRDRGAWSRRPAPRHPGQHPAEWPPGQEVVAVPTAGGVRPVAVAADDETAEWIGLLDPAAVLDLLDDAEAAQPTVCSCSEEHLARSVRGSAHQPWCPMVAPAPRYPAASAAYEALLVQVARKGAVAGSTQRAAQRLLQVYGVPWREGR
jgi:hypothetical protein